jgi:flagellar protein FliL
MSKSAPAAADEADGKPKKKGKLLIIIGLIAVLAGGGGGAWFFMQPKAGAKAAHAKKEKSAKPPTFVELDTFTVNLQPHSEGQFLQTALVAKLTDAAAGEQIKTHMPEIKNRILLLMSSKTAEELSSLKGKEQLGKAIAGQIKATLTDKEQAQHVAGVLFTSFVIQ